jgi:hypothetical protein
MISVAPDAESLCSLCLQGRFMGDFFGGVEPVGGQAPTTINKMG